MASAALNKIERAHQMYREGKYSEALGFYTEALSMAKTNPQKIALHSNRAACFLKLHHFNKAAEECTSVLELDRDHTGALMLRAQTLALGFESIIRSLSKPSCSFEDTIGKSLAPIPESEAELEQEDDEDEARPNKNEEEQYKEEIVVERDQKAEVNRTIINAEVIVSEMLRSKKPNEQERDKSEPKRISSTTAVTAPKLQSNKELLKQDPKVQSNKELLKQDPKVQSNKESLKQDPIVQSKKESFKQDSKVQSNKELEQDTKGWQTIPKPKGHSTLDYARWDRVEDDSSEEEDDDDDDEESQPQYRFRLRTVGVRPVK
nr:protein unc-45 like a [Quercus suber]